MKYCVHCGKKQQLKTDTFTGEIKPCMSCHKKPVHDVTLLLNLGEGELTARVCPNCQKLNQFDPFCFFCGLKFSSSS